MARPLRLEFAGALYHVTSRGDRREDIFEDDKDGETFLAILGDICRDHKGAIKGTEGLKFNRLRSCVTQKPSR